MTATATPAIGRTARPAAGGALAGTGLLLRFALRRDRVRIPVWLAALVLGTVWPVTAFREVYPTEAARQAAAATMNSPAGLAFSGPAHYLSDYHYGSMVSHQVLGFLAIFVGIMSVLLVIRHTRAEEEAGRAELIRAGVVGRHAPLAAALILATAVNLALGLPAHGGRRVDRAGGGDLGGVAAVRRGEHGGRDHVRRGRGGDRAAHRALPGRVRYGPRGGRGGLSRAGRR